MPDISIDWLSFSYEKKNEYDFDFYSFLKGLVNDFNGSFQYCNYSSLFGYECSYRCSELGINVFWDKAYRWHIDLSGKGCQFVSHYSDFSSFLKRVFESKANVTRLDLAGDDFLGIIDLDDIERCYATGSWRGSARCIDMRCPRGNNGKRVSGCTFYVGSPASDCYIRIYDKQAQMNSDKPWVRCELQLRHKYASVVVALYAAQDFDQISSLYSRICFDRIKFLVKKDSNCHSCYDIPCNWWFSFLNGCSVGLKLTRDDDLDLHKTLFWLENKCSSALALYRELYTFSGLIRLSDDGKKNFSKRHQIMLAELRAEERYLDYAERIERLSDREYRDIEEIFNGSEESGKFSCYS